jgi:tetratricopeptide (TPR) repeat protein
MDINNNTSNRNQAIENYIQRVTELTQMGNRVLSHEELLKIASELGITDDEIAIAQQQSQAHFLRAQGYYNLAHWDEAISELENALEVNPFNLPMLHLLVKSHLGRWQQKHSRKDEEQIKIRIKQCLEIQPDDQESLKLLAELDKLINNYRYQLWGFSGLLLLGFGLVIGLFFPPNISLSSLIAREDELQQINNELNEQIGILKEEQMFLHNELSRENQQLKQANEQLEFKIQDLENQINNLTFKQQELIKKINRPVPRDPLEFLPSDRPNIIELP